MKKKRHAFKPIPRAELKKLSVEELISLKFSWWLFALELGILDTIKILMHRTHLDRIGDPALMDHYSFGPLTLTEYPQPEEVLGPTRYTATWRGKVVFDSEVYLAVPGKWVEALFENNAKWAKTENGIRMDGLIKKDLVKELEPAKD